MSSRKVPVAVTGRVSARGARPVGGARRAAGRVPSPVFPFRGVFRSLCVTLLRTAHFHLNLTPGGPVSCLSHTQTNPPRPYPDERSRLRAPGRMLLSTDRTAIWQKSTPEVISQFTRTSEKSLFPRACCNFLVPFHLQSDYTHPRSHQGTEAESRFNRR